MTKPQIILLVIAIAVAAIIIDSHMPLASFKLNLTDSVSVKFLVYDSADGFLQMTFRNIKSMVSFYKGVQ